MDLPPWILEPIVITGIVGLVGVLVGSFLRRRSESEQHDLSVLKATVEAMQTRISHLSTEVDGLREQVRAAEKERRLAWEKYSAALSYIRLLLSIIAGEKPVLKIHGLTPPEVPDPPENISIDM